MKKVINILDAITTDDIQKVVLALAAIVILITAVAFVAHAEEKEYKCKLIAYASSTLLPTAKFSEVEFTTNDVEKTVNDFLSLKLLTEKEKELEKNADFNALATYSLTNFEFLNGKKNREKYELVCEDTADYSKSEKIKIARHYVVEGYVTILDFNPAK